MIKRLVARLFPSSGLSRTTWLLWASLIALAPLAYLASGVLILKTSPSANVSFPHDRAGIVRAAAHHAGSLGYDIAGWTSGVKVGVDNDRYYYYLTHTGEEAERLSRIAPATRVDVIFLSPDLGETLEVELTPDGQPLGYDFTPSRSAESADPGEAESKKLALEAFRPLRERLGLPDSAEPASSEDRMFNRVTRRYTWQLPHPSLPHLKVRIALAVLGGKVIEQDVMTEFDSAYARTNFVNRFILPKVAVGLYVVLLIVVAVYGLFRYVRRSWQKEVPHARSFLLGGIASLTLFSLSLQSQFHIFSMTAGGGGALQYWVQFVAFGVFFGLYGMTMGLAYGGGEGDVREAYPGKLTSLDALLTGRFFARNVARALLVGTAVGGWSLFASVLILLPWATRPASGPGLAEHFYTLFYGSAPWLLPLTGPPLGAIQIASLGLLLPLSFLLRRRRLRSARVRLALIALLSFVTALSVFQEQPTPLVAGLLIAAARTAILLLLFFTFDLLTAMIGAAAPALLLNVLFFAAQPPAAMQRAGYVAAGLALAALAGAVFFLLRGREYREEEVRPLYARHLAERQRLEAEVSAAREAQTRLLPQKLPEVSGLGLAAACHPSRVVGGDFYDLFTLGEQRLAVFVAEGGNYGLGAALTIAYAKGFLMPRVVAEHTPAEIVCSLQERLTPMLEENQELALVYAVFDAPSQTLTYARAGRYPQVRISRDPNPGGDGGPARGKRTARRRHIEPDEQAIQTSAGTAAIDAARNCVLRAAQVRLVPGDAVFFVTDAIVESLEADGKEGLEEWTSKVFSGRSSGALQPALDKALEKRARRNRKIGAEDDLTAVLVYLKPTEVTSDK
ncbi:MAG: PP2C family protein-serine/threonine phosphatase [Pyrinomonadaceae bacterium]